MEDSEVYRAVCFSNRDNGCKCSGKYEIKIIKKKNKTKQNKKQQQQQQQNQETKGKDWKDLYSGHTDRHSDH